MKRQEIKFKFWSCGFVVGETRNEYCSSYSDNGFTFD